jgi:hypothetical protein
MDNDYITNHILTCEFGFFCDSYFKTLTVNNEKLFPSQIINFNRVR